jgi:predicted transcriptional regulator/uncharacterized small protein (DUF1192 family)
MCPIASEQDPLRYPLNEIFGTQAHIRVLRVMAVEVDGPLTASDIAKRTGLTVPGAQKSLGKLLRTGFISRVGGGRKHQYEIRRSDRLMQIAIELFQSEKKRYESLLSAIKNEIKNLTPSPHAAWIQAVPREIDEPLIFMKLITRMPKIDPEKVTPEIAQLLSIIELQIKEIQLLKDEIARLKGQKPKPKIKPSILEKQSSAAKKKKRNKRAKKSKKIEVHEVVPIEPEHIPTGSTYKGYQDYLVQDLIISNWNICYRRMRWKTPDGRYIIGSLPDEISGTHFGPTLTAFILYQYYGCHLFYPPAFATLGS